MTIMRNTRRTATLLLMLIILFSMSTAVLASPKFNKTNTISVNRGKKKTGKLKSLSKKQKKKNWRFVSSDTSVAKVKGTGKYGYKITAKKKDGYAIIRASQGKAKVYLLVKVGKGSKTQNSTTKNWAKGRFKFPSSSQAKAKGNTNDNSRGNGDNKDEDNDTTTPSKPKPTYTESYSLTDVPSQLTMIYTDTSACIGRASKSYTFGTQNGKIVVGEKDIQITSSSPYVSVDMRNDTVGKQDALIYVTPSNIKAWSGGYVTTPGIEAISTYDIPENGIKATVTISYKGITKQVAVTVTDFGIPDKQLRDQWIAKVMRESYADLVNASNVMRVVGDLYDQDGYIAEADIETKIRLVKLHRVIGYIDANYEYGAGHINEFMCEKHGWQNKGVCDDTAGYTKFFAENVIGGLSVDTERGTSSNPMHAWARVWNADRTKVFWIVSGQPEASPNAERTVDGLVKTYAEEREAFKRKLLGQQ